MIDYLLSMGVLVALSIDFSSLPLGVPLAFRVMINYLLSMGFPVALNIDVCRVKKYRKRPERDALRMKMRRPGDGGTAGGTAGASPAGAARHLQARALAPPPHLLFLPNSFSSSRRLVLPTLPPPLTPPTGPSEPPSVRVAPSDTGPCRVPEVGRGASAQVFRVGASLFRGCFGRTRSPPGGGGGGPAGGAGGSGAANAESRCPKAP